MPSNHYVVGMHSTARCDVTSPAASREDTLQSTTIGLCHTVTTISLMVVFAEDYSDVWL
jgi:hypothetical protein